MGAGWGAYARLFGEMSDDCTLMCIFRRVSDLSGRVRIVNASATHHDFVFFCLSFPFFDKTSKHVSKKGDGGGLWDCIVRFCTTISAFTRVLPKAAGSWVERKGDGGVGGEFPGRLLHVGEAGCS